jgi:predicted DNA binding protein
VTSRDDLQPIRELPLGSHHFLEGLTQRQTSALIRAFDEGLLDVPARGRWDAAARREGLSRSTFGEHIRKGQWRLIANAYGGLRSRVGPEPEPILLPKLRPRSRRKPIEATPDR